jgi:hypothetical protein
LRNLNVHQFERFGSAGLLYLNGFHESLDYPFRSKDSTQRQLNSQTLTTARPAGLNTENVACVLE